MLLNRFSVCAVAAAAALVSSPVLAGPVTLEHILENPTPGDFDYYGGSVDISGNRAIIGATGDDVNGIDQGSAYIIDVTTGAIVSTLINPNPDGNAGDSFGVSVAIDGNIAVVGSTLSDGASLNQGVAYVFDVNSGNLLTTLENPNGVGDTFDRFGTVDISGDTILVGAEREGGGGAAYLFDALSGSLLHTLSHPSPEFADAFGGSVSIDEGLVAIGARTDDASFNDEGSVHIYETDTGNYIRTLENPSPQVGDKIGTSVSLDNGMVLVGAPGDQSSGFVGSGQAYLFDALTGEILRTIPNPDIIGVDSFGSSVALSDGFAMVGAPRRGGGVYQAGASYLFNTFTGDLVSAIPNPFPGEQDWFSDLNSGVAIDGETIVVGSFRADATGTDSGRAYIFSADLSGQSTDPDFPGPDPDPDTVPTPGAAMIFGFGLLGLAATRRRAPSPV